MEAVRPVKFKECEVTRLALTTDGVEVTKLTGEEVEYQTLLLLDSLVVQVMVAPVTVGAAAMALMIGAVLSTVVPVVNDCCELMAVLP